MARPKAPRRERTPMEAEMLAMKRISRILGSLPDKGRARVMAWAVDLAAEEKLVQKELPIEEKKEG